MNDNKINVEKWLESYVKLINFGSRHIKNVEKTDNKIILEYTNYTNCEKKEFVKILPRNIIIDDEFQYFFGLWCGDKIGGGRIGVSNKAPEINLITQDYLEKIYQKPFFQMQISSKLKYIPKPHVRVDGIVKIKNMSGDYVMAVFSVNGILKRFFNYLLESLDEVISILPKKEIFFAGLFDAEGNVSLEDRYFRWSCKNLKEVEIYKKHLANLDLFKRYDNSSLITNNRKVFLNCIYPHIRQKDKINRIKLLFFNEGYLENQFKSILITINDSPGKTVSELNQTFKKKKMWPRLKFLHDCGYIRREGYPMKLHVTEKGLQEIRREGQ